MPTQTKPRLFPRATPPAISNSLLFYSSLSEHAVSAALKPPLPKTTPTLGEGALNWTTRVDELEGAAQQETKKGTPRKLIDSSRPPGRAAPNDVHGRGDERTAEPVEVLEHSKERDKRNVQTSNVPRRVQD